MSEAARPLAARRERLPDWRENDLTIKAHDVS